MVCVRRSRLSLPQTFDLRGATPNVPVIRHGAHNALVLTLQYHPRWKDVLASGGRDTLVKVRDDAPLSLHATTFLGFLLPLCLPPYPSPPPSPHSFAV